MRRGCSYNSGTARWTILVALLLSVGATERAWGAEARTLTLDQCISTAMERNHQRSASSFAVAAAEAQHRQALSGYWPHVGFKGGYLRTDQAPNFIFPAGNIHVPASSFQTPGMTMTIPANAFGPGFPPQDVQIPVPPQTIDVPAQQIPVAEQETKLMDESSVIASLNARWLLWGGGMRKEIGRASCRERV